MQIEWVFCGSGKGIVQHILVRTTHIHTLQTHEDVYIRSEHNLIECFICFSEGCLACITAYLVYMCAETHYEKVRRPNMIHSICWYHDWYLDSSYSYSLIIYVCLFTVHSKDIEIHCITKWTSIQSKRSTNHRSNIQGPPSHRNIHIGSSWPNLNAHNAHSIKATANFIYSTIDLFFNINWDIHWYAK